MDFSSDTSAPAHPAILEAIAAANHGTQPSYGADETMKALRKRLQDVFETDDLDVWPCASGTASNALALSVLVSPLGAVLCHEEAHIERDERSAPEFFTGGAKLRLLDGANGKIDETRLREAIAANQPDFVHETPAEVLSLTQLTECGTAYSAEQLIHYAALAMEANLRVHIDGARFGNALAATDATPAEMSWKAGADILTLGLTKTGAIGCELILLFGDARRTFAQLRARAKRSGHMPPKMRFIAAQALAMLENDLWLDLSARANRAARLLADALCKKPETELVYPVDGNEVFVRLDHEVASALEKGGARFYPWPGGCYRFVCSWATRDEEISELADCLGG